MESVEDMVDCKETFSGDPDPQKVYMVVLQACVEITMHIRYNSSSKSATANDFGDARLLTSTSRLAHYCST